MTYNLNAETLLLAAGDIFGECHQLAKNLRANPEAEPSSKNGTTPDGALLPTTEVARLKTRILGQVDRLARLLRDPHEILHEFVASNWELGALYTVLQFNVLEQIPLDGSAHIATLADAPGLPEDKLLRILRLLACKQITVEVDAGYFSHTAVSQELIDDKKLKAFVQFQLYETRIASAYLADSLRIQPNAYGTGDSAFKRAWGLELYAWHEVHPEEAARFRLAMQGVTQSLDPGNQLFRQWFRDFNEERRNTVIEIGGRYGYATVALAETFPNLSFEVRDSSPAILEREKQSMPSHLQERISFMLRSNNLDPQPIVDADKTPIYVIRNVLWNWSDHDAVRLLRSVVPVMEKAPETVVLISDGISPAKDIFEPHVEVAYRRRDITMMTMHNVKQRTESEWRGLFAKASPCFKVLTTTAATSHVYKGLWELRWAPPSENGV